MTQNNHRREQFEELAETQKLTWKTLQKQLSQIERYAKDILDPTTELVIEDGSMFSEMERYEKYLGKLLTRFMLLHIPLHYKANGKMYLVREECEHILFSEEHEHIVEDINVRYHLWQSFTRPSVKKEEAFSAYENALKQARAKGLRFLAPDASTDCWRLEGDDQGEWLRRL